MKTWSGLEAPLHPDAGFVSVLDLVVQLGRVRRFGGVGSTEWTVLHHSVLVALLWLRAGYPASTLHHALLHDAHEAYTGDIPGPIKAAIRARECKDIDTMKPTDAIKGLEQDLDQRIRDAVRPRSDWEGDGAPDDETRRRVKICDLAALIIEGMMFGAPGCDCRVDVPEHLATAVFGMLNKMPEIRAAAIAHGRSTWPLDGPEGI